MPTYEYHCPKGHAFDVFQKMSDPAVAKCPECGAHGQRMIVPGAGFLFKGDGFYITETRSDDYKKKASMDDAAGGEGSGKKEGGVKEGEAKGGDKKEVPVTSGGKDAGSKEGGAKQVPPPKASRGESSSGGDE
jgi:putative FmdB family regulatory protein